MENFSTIIKTAVNHNKNKNIITGNQTCSATRRGWKCASLIFAHFHYLFSFLFFLGFLARIGYKRRITMHKAGGAPLWLWRCEYVGSDDGLVIVLALKVYLFKVGDDGKSWLLCEGIVVMIGS